MDPFIMIEKQKHKNLLPEEYYFVFKNEYVSIPIIINLTKIVRIPKIIQIISFSTPYNYFKGIIYYEGQTIPVIDLKKYFQHSKSIDSATQKNNQKNNVNSITSIFKTKNDELLGISGLKLYDQIHRSQIISETILDNYLTEKIFSKAVSLENGELMLVLDLEELFTKIKKELLSFFESISSLHLKKLYLVKDFKQKLALGFDESKKWFSILPISPKKQGLRNTKRDELEYDLLVKVSGFVYAFNLRNVFAVLKQFHVLPLPQVDNSLLIGWTQVKNINVFVVDPIVLSTNTPKPYLIKDLARKSLIVLSHPHIQGYWGIPVDEVLPATSVKERNAEAKNVIGITSEIDSSLVFEAISWRNETPVFHIHTERFLRKIANNQVFNITLTGKTSYLFRKSEIYKRTEKTVWDETLFIQVFHENILYELELSNLEHIFRKLEVFSLEKDVPSVKGWAVYGGKIMPVINLMEISNVISHTTDVLDPSYSYVVIHLKNSEKNSISIFLALPGVVSIGESSLKYPLKRINLPFLIKNQFFKKIGFSSNSKYMVITLNQDYLAKELVKIYSKFISKYKPKKDALERALEKDEYLKISEIERYKYKEENLGTFIFESSGVLIGVDENYLISFIGKYNKLEKRVSQLKETGKDSNQDNPDRTVIIVIDSLFSEQCSLSNLSFIELTDNTSKIIVGFSEPYGIYYYDKKDLVNLQSLSFKDKIVEIKNSFSAVAGKNLLSNSGKLEKLVDLFYAKFTFSKYFSELSGRSVLLLDISKLKTLAKPIFEFWREKNNHPIINRSNRRRNLNGESTNL